MITDLFVGFVLVGLGFLSVCFFRVGTKILFANSASYERNRQNSPGTISAIKGEGVSSPSRNRDYAVAAGIALDTKNNRWVEQGKLSKEAIQEMLD